LLQTEESRVLRAEVTGEYIVKFLCILLVCFLFGTS
jgi:hypothetical protein